MTIKINYRWWANVYSGGIYETAEAANSINVFATFGEARTALGDHFAAMERHSAAARYRARNLKKADIKEGEWTI